MNNRHACHRLSANRPGATLLITVMILGTVALFIGISLALRGIGEMEMSNASYHAQKTLNIADGCMEEALKRLWSAPGYEGGALSLGDGECTISVGRASEGTRVIRVQANVRNWIRTLKAHVDAESMEMQILEWQQVR